MHEQADMGLSEEFAQERRARLAAERLLEQKRRELYEANRELASHARHLTEEIFETRVQKQELQDRTEAALVELETAQGAVQIAEQRLWESIETISDGFAVFDSADRLVTANTAYIAAFDGIEAVQPGVSYRELLQIVVEEGIVDTEGAGRDDWVEEMAWRWRSKTIPARTVRFWNGAYAKLVDRRAESGDTVSLALNITSEIRNQRRLRVARRKAEAASRAKSAFLANMSHEIRTPMNGVVGMAQLLESTQLSEEQGLYVETIRGSAEALLVLINDVLDYSKVDADRLVLHNQEFDLEQSVYEVARLLRPSDEAKKVEVLVDYDMFMPTHFVGDPGRVRQILTNLVGNAVKFTEAGHVLIRVSSLPDSDTEAQRVHVSVEDTGIGIAADKTEHIFGEFNQADDKRSRRYEGTGLGLAITRRLVQLMGGEIWVDSELGRGSNFGFYVTLRPGAEAALPTLPAIGIDRVLIVDPLFEGRDIIRRQIASLRLKALAFESVAQCKAVGPKERDLILLDSGLEDPAAQQYVTELRDGGFTGPIFLMGMSATAERADGLLPKPLKRQDIVRLLSEFHLPRNAIAASGDATGQKRPLRVLAAEDNQTNRLVFEKLVKEAKIDLVFVENGREAIESFEEQRPDLIFMDISMPEIDGKEATRRIRGIEQAQGWPRVPIVAMTAHALIGDRDEILAAGLDRYMTKPLKKDTVLGQIAEFCPADCLPPLGDEPAEPGIPEATAAIDPHPVTAEPSGPPATFRRARRA